MGNIFSVNFLYALIILCGPLNFGFIMGFTSPALPEFDRNWNVSKINMTMFNAVTSLFAIFGPYIATFLLIYLNRKETTAIVSAFTALFWGLLTLIGEDSFGWGIALRALFGLSIGAYSSLSPMMLVEIAPKDQTGFYGGLNQCGIVIGIMIMYLQGTWCSWKDLCITGVVISVLQTALIWFIPGVGTKDGKEIETHEKCELCHRKYLKKLSIGVMMMIFQQFSGINALITNLDSQFASAGVPIKSGIAATISVSSQFVAVFIGALLVDKFGRRPLWCISTAGCAACLFLYAINEATKIANWLAIFIIFLYMFFFGIALGPVPWFIIPELFPDSIRSLASSVISTSNWTFVFIVLFLYPVVEEGIGKIWTFVLFGILTTVASIYGYFYIKEPSEINLEEDSDNITSEYTNADDIDVKDHEIKTNYQSTDKVVESNISNSNEVHYEQNNVIESPYSTYNQDGDL